MIEIKFLDIRREITEIMSLAFAGKSDEMLGVLMFALENNTQEDMVKVNNAAKVLVLAAQEFRGAAFALQKEIDAFYGDVMKDDDLKK